MKLGFDDNIGRSHLPKNWKKSSPCHALALGEGDLFPESQLLALEEGISSPSAPSLVLGEGPLPRVPTKALGELFFIFPPFFCEAFPHYLKLLAQIWLTFEFFCYISLVFSFS
jgi:hypothetical protein